MSERMDSSRRDFLKNAAVYGGMLMAAGQGVAGQAGSAAAGQGTIAPHWKTQIGLQLYTVRDKVERAYEETLAAVAALGYREIEATDFGGMAPKQFRALLDRYGLKSVSTHAAASGATVDELERVLEGYQIIGLKYTTLNMPSGRGGGGGRGQAPARGAGQAAGRGGGRGSATVDSVNERAARLNEYGRIARKFGMKLQIHNHANEFAPLAGTSTTTYDVLLAETDPDLVTMQLDIGWAHVAGQNVVEMFRKHPGRYELWHVKDVFGLSTVNSAAGAAGRRTIFVPVGRGEVDYRSMFAHADVAGLKHFVVEQDNAADWGDSLAAARVSFQSLQTILA